MEPDFSHLQNQRYEERKNSSQDRQIQEKSDVKPEKKEVKKAKKKVTRREFFSMSHEDQWMPEKQPKSGGLAMMGLNSDGKQIGKWTKAQEARQKQLGDDHEHLEDRRKNQADVVEAQVNDMHKTNGNMNSKLVCIRFKIERKSIKNGAREERRASIHKLEQEKNIAFHPKRDRSKSIPIVNMNLRLKSLKDMKEDMLIKKSRVNGEILLPDYEPRPLLNEYNNNAIDRKIISKPYRLLIQTSPRRKWLQPGPNGEYDHSIDDLPIYGEGNQEAEESAEQRLICEKIVRTQKYKSNYHMTEEELEHTKVRHIGAPDNENPEEEVKAHEQRQDFVERTANIGQFISYLNINGLNFNSVHNHIRSNSVGGVTVLDHQKLTAYLKNDLGVSNAPDLSALNIQEVYDINVRFNNRADQQQPQIQDQIEEEVQQLMLMNPMNFLSQDAFIAMVKDIETNKVLQVQLSQINKVHKINGINSKKVLQNQSMGAKLPDEVLLEFQIEQATMQLTIINKYVHPRKKHDPATSDQQLKHQVELYLEKVKQLSRHMFPKEMLQRTNLLLDELFNMNQIQLLVSKQQQCIYTKMEKREQLRKASLAGMCPMARGQSNLMSQGLGSGQLGSPQRDNSGKSVEDAEVSDHSGGGGRKADRKKDNGQPMQKSFSGPKRTNGQMSFDARGHQIDAEKVKTVPHARSTDSLNNSNISNNSIKGKDQLLSNKSQVSQHSNGSECSGKGSVFKKDYSVKRAMATAKVPEGCEEQKEQDD